MDARDQAQDVGKDERLAVQGVYFTAGCQVLQFEESNGEKGSKMRVMMEPSLREEHGFESQES